ncbi:hypothetical protein HGB13_04245 [bacterium]|nr:hypothetical protein [bacterium]
MLSLETPLSNINVFFNFIWQEYICAKISYHTLIRVIPKNNLTDKYSIYRNGKIAYDWGQKLDSVPYSHLSKALENVVSGHAFNQIDKKDFITLHSGALSKSNNGILLLGDSGNGKSTLTLELTANHDWLYLSDEVGLINPNLMIHPFLKTVSCKKTGIVKINDNWETRSFGIDTQVAVPREKHGKPVPLQLIFFVKYSPDAKPEIVPIKKSDALIRLMNAQIGRAKYVATIEQMAEVVKKADAFLLHHNDCTKAAELIDNLIGAS